MFKLGLRGHLVLRFKSTFFQAKPGYNCLCTTPTLVLFALIEVDPLATKSIDIYS